VKREERGDLQVKISKHSAYAVTHISPNLPPTLTQVEMGSLQEEHIHASSPSKMTTTILICGEG
jgi:hypothetical protein